MLPEEIAQQAEIVNACLSGDKEAKKKFYDLFARTMFGICLRYTSNYDDAKDLLHDGFLQAYLSMKNFRNEGSLEGWVKRIFINTGLQKLRNKKNAAPEEQLEMAETITFAVIQHSRISQEEIMKLIQKLPTGYRTVFNLFVIDGFSHAEIATMTGISESTSKTQLKRAREWLQQRITKQNEWQTTKK